ncbi:MAG: hypothetical protein WBE13_12980 [Candidatus Acidiferrum sp.]
MRFVKAVELFLCAFMLCAILGTGTKADTWNRKTIVTFSDSVEIPGQILPPGTYVFKLFNSIADRDIVQVWTGDETQLLATLMAVPDYRPEPPDEPLFWFDERPAGSPVAIHSWFYPGDTKGEDFIYPE